jgi:hypothetical protein
VSTWAWDQTTARSVDSIAERALRFARTFDFINHSIVRCEAARPEFVQRYGTPNLAEYREVEIHMDWGPERRELIKSCKAEEREIAESLLDKGVDLLVVCSSTDIIHHEFLGMDLH